MADHDRVRAAADHLYAADPAEFTDQRADLVAQARAAGDKTAARAIGALRRPTRAAWVVNRLARTDPAAVVRLTGLGDELRAAESALDGDQLRELSRDRRALLAELTRQALDGADVADPPDALQQEVTGTLGAALADPEVAATLAAGQLVKAVQPGGFGFGPGTGHDQNIEGLVTRSQPRPGPRRRQRDEDQRDQEQRGADQKRPDQKRVERERAAQKRAERERAERARAELERQRQAITDAEQTLAEADQAVDAAHAAEEDREHTVRRLETQLEDAQDALADSKRRSREARTAQRQARKGLERLRDRANQLPVTAGYRAILGSWQTR